LFLPINPFAGSEQTSVSQNASRKYGKFLPDFRDNISTPGESAQKETPDIFPSSSPGDCVNTDITACTFRDTRAPAAERTLINQKSEHRWN